MLGEEERRAVLEVLESGVLAHGPKIRAFEQAFCAFTGAPHAVAVASCTAGLHLYYFAAGLGPGDEVLVPAMTHTATAHAVELTGARAVFVDAEPRTCNMDLDALEAAITPRTRAISPMHYLGYPLDMERVRRIADARSLMVVEDCALALGTRLHGTHAGLFGAVGCFSFYPVKHITTAEGGMVICRDEALARRFERVRAFGMDKHVGERTVPGLYDVQELGFNYRMSDIEAAIGCEQLRKLPRFLEARRANHRVLLQELKAIEEVAVLHEDRPGFEPSYYCLVALLRGCLAARRNDVLLALKELGIGTSVY